MKAPPSAEDDENDNGVIGTNGETTAKIPLNQVEEHISPTQQQQQSLISWRPRARASRGAFSWSITKSNSEDNNNSSTVPTRTSSTPPMGSDFGLGDVESGGGTSGSAGDITATAASNHTNSNHNNRRITGGFIRGGMTPSILRRSSIDGSDVSSSDSLFGMGNSRDEPLSPQLQGVQPSTRVTKRSTFLGLPLFSQTAADSIDAPHPPLNSGGGGAPSSTATGGGQSNNTNGGIKRTVRNRITAFRRYGVGDYVLISNHNLPIENSITLVNRYGFPEYGISGATTSEERRGPYIYLIAQVTSVHFGEDAQYYTVKRGDNHENQRADAQYMEPITNLIGIDAAKKTAARHKENDENGKSRRDGIRGSEYGKFKWLRPCIATVENCTRSCSKGFKNFARKTKIRLDACLNGNKPYGISCRFTGVNFFVLCSIWYLYIDQLRLAFMPHSVDYGCAIVSCIVWVCLFLELIMEVFVRPSDYHALILSDRAYLPSTVRYLNTFHLVSEMLSLIFFIPEFVCLFGEQGSCGDRYQFSLANACLMALYGPDRLHAFYGTAFLCMLRLRIFGLVRHWTKMWINNTFVRVRGKNGEWRVQRGKGFFVPQGYRRGRGQEHVISMEESIAQSSLTPKHKMDGSLTMEEKKTAYTDDYHLTNASKIGTALFTTNAKRGLVFVFLIGLAPLIPVVFKQYGGTNQQLQNSVDLLQSNNIVLNSTDEATCNQLENTMINWVKSVAFEAAPNGDQYKHLLALKVEPVRCEFQTINGTEVGTLAAIACQNSDTMERCRNILPVESCHDICLAWMETNEEDRMYVIENYYGIRPGTTIPVATSQPGPYYSDEESGEMVSDTYSVRVLYNEQLSVRQTIIILFILQLSMTLFVLLGLSVMRADAGRLVLGPLRRMLKIVAFYAKNPLSPPPQKDASTGASVRMSFQLQNEAYYDSDDETYENKQLGTFETEQLINAVTKITDLLRKCWGVAGAGIISSNLARQQGGLTTYFNPTVPGKAVYALFAFACIDRFQNHLHALKGDIMILINDIAAVLHEEVYRWGYEESGQCNKNLGGAFLMVYRIGAVSEVLEKRDRAEAVIFSAKQNGNSRRRKSRRIASSQHLGASSARTASSSRRASTDTKHSRSHVDNLDLSSLPGMRTFADRALLGLLKTFAGIHRDKVILNWNNDFRLGAGVGAVSINLNYGMDAGWAVEGAVGSSYKIDATYLSPHVNMASRMMSATKQYGVYILLSQAVQKLLSSNAQDKLRHIDTVTVKGSSVQQRIYTYDAKVRSDFFLYSKTESQADLDSDRYSPAIWNTDQDLVAMRNHICDEFMEVFRRGRNEYLAGNWPAAIELLKSADKIMFELEVDEGYSARGVYSEHFKSLTNIDDNDEAEERLSMGDGPCQRLIAYMESLGGQAPSGWRGYRPLTSK